MREVCCCNGGDDKGLDEGRGGGKEGRNGGRDQRTGIVSSADLAGGKSSASLRSPHQKHRAALLLLSGRNRVVGR